MAQQTDRIEKKIVLRAPCERVWQAVTDAKKFGTWFGAEFAGEFVAGKRLNARITATKMDAQIAKEQEPYTGTPFEIVVECIDPMRLFSFWWHPYPVEAGADYAQEPMTLVSFELEPVPEGTLLTITESGFDKVPLARRAQAFTQNEGGWAAQIKLVEKYVMGLS